MTKNITTDRPRCLTQSVIAYIELCDVHYHFEPLIYPCFTFFANGVFFEGGPVSVALARLAVTFAVVLVER